MLCHTLLFPREDGRGHNTEYNSLAAVGRTTARLGPYCPRLARSNNNPQQTSDVFFVKELLNFYHRPRAPPRRVMQNAPDIPQSTSTSTRREWGRDSKSKV